jgi:hypothetical protein
MLDLPLDGFSPPDPARAAPYPQGLSLDLALETGTLESILESYSLTKEDFILILRNPAFKKELEEARESMKQEGWSFRKKAAYQAELYLHRIYDLIGKDTTPANVKADLIKATVRWAGYDAPVLATQANNGFDPAKIAEQMKTLTDGELEVRVAQIVFRNTKPQEPQPTGITYEAE